GAMAAAHLWAGAGRIGRAMRTKPYVPSFRRMAARITEPTVGASVWASGNHVWNGNMGTLMAKPMNRPANIHTCVLVASRRMGESAAASAGMSNVGLGPLLK